MASSLPLREDVELGIADEEVSPRAHAPRDMKSEWNIIADGVDEVREQVSHAVNVSETPHLHETAAKEEPAPVTGMQSGRRVEQRHMVENVVNNGDDVGKSTADGQSGCTDGNGEMDEILDGGKATLSDSGLNSEERGRNPSNEDDLLKTEDVQPGLLLCEDVVGEHCNNHDNLANGCGSSVRKRKRLDPDYAPESDDDDDSSLEVIHQVTPTVNCIDDDCDEVTAVVGNSFKAHVEEEGIVMKMEQEVGHCDEVVIVAETKAEPTSLQIVAKDEIYGVKAENGFMVSPSGIASENDKQLIDLKTKIGDQRKVVQEFHQLLNHASGELNALEQQLAERMTQLRRAADAAFDWNANTFPWDRILARELRDVFKIASFRPLQRESLNATLLRRDVFSILPTGAGKSLIYQLAAVVDRGLTLVITPLISLSLDQQRALRALHIRAESLDFMTSKNVSKRIYKEIVPLHGQVKNSKTPRKKRRRVEKKKRGIQSASPSEWLQDDMEPAILFVTPEQLVRNKKLMSRVEMMYEAGHLSRIVIDEAHCCSSWGHDFRADYRKLGILKRQCPQTPIVALSATCCPDTTLDVCKTLEIPNSVVFRGSIDRPNLFYEVRRKKDNEDDVIVDIASLLLNEFKDQCGIIYVLSRKESETYSTSLNALDIRTGCYHGEMTRQDRSIVHEGWQNGNLQVVVATIAFGLGIDNQKTRFVIHATMATSLEGYYQESGRAGRNGMPAKCVLLHRAKDFARLSGFVADKGDGRLRKFYDIYRYASGRGIGKNAHSINRCRRDVIATSFGETPPPRKDDQRSQCCDLCAADVSEVMVLRDATEIAKSVLRIMRHMTNTYPSEKITLLNLASIWSNTGLKGKRFRGTEPPLDRRISVDVRLEILIGLIFAGALEEYHRHSSYAVNAYVTIGENFGTFFEEAKSFEVVLRETDASALSEVNLL